MRYSVLWSKCGAVKHMVAIRGIRQLLVAVLLCIMQFIRIIFCLSACWRNKGVRNDTYAVVVQIKISQHLLTRPYPSVEETPILPSRP